ncbi:hypothetical protein Plec18167_004248 [Paecilomyces lecythidis]|uniref:Fructose-bisphosphate aldolase n=1 Tax=Paecilomyces lecythidis TaxID=3004212 RepID=A0ABR3XTN1_9EURO
MPRPPLSQNRTLHILNNAREGGYAVPGFCCYNLEAVLAAVKAAEATSSPSIVQLFPWAIEYAGNSLVQAAAELCHSASVPMALHLDHAQTPELIRRAAEIPDGFDSIMCDMSHYEKDENLAKTKELVAYCHERGITTEAEPGRIEGGEDGVAETLDLEGVLTTPEQAEEFVGTGIEMLAPAFGNVHGEYGPRGIKLEYNRLQSIHAAVGDRVRLVLHGADPFTKDIYERCIAAGVVKININRGINDEYTVPAMQGKSRPLPLTAMIETGTKNMQEAAEKYMHWFGCAGKA